MYSTLFVERCKLNWLSQPVIQSISKLFRLLGAPGFLFLFFVVFAVVVVLRGRELPESVWLFRSQIKKVNGFNIIDLKILYF